MWLLKEIHLFTTLKFSGFMPLLSGRGWMWTLTCFHPKGVIRIKWAKRYVSAFIITKRRFSILASLLFWARKFFVEGCPVWCRSFGSTLSLYLLDDSNSLSPAVTIKSISRHCQMSPGGWGVEGQIIPVWEPLLLSHILTSSIVNYITTLRGSK